MLYSCIETPTIVGQEESPKVRSLLPVGQGSISDRHTLNTRISIKNTSINVRATLTSFSALCLAGIAYTSNCQMILLLTVVWYLQREFCMSLVNIPEKSKNY